MTTGFETLLVETAGSICTVTLNRPNALNALNERMTAELAQVIHELQQAADVRCVVLTGAGRAFSSGQDLGDLKTRYANADFVPHLADDLRRRYEPVVLGLRALAKPVVAAINGVAAGAGLSLALACDLRIASDNASLIEVFINVGLVPDSGNTFFLPRLIGLGKAMELCFTGDKLPANDALAMGLVNKVVLAENLMRATLEIAQKLARLPTAALGLTKRLLYQSMNSNLEAQLEAEARAQEIAGLTADHREGVRAFFEKRPPQFQGK
jgi:2-(1,2-epoxy-1,2-dihydrophenyl)acetyl-CoA isomerase